MPKNSEVREALAKIKSGEITLDEYDSSLVVERKGRTPSLPYEELQQGAHEVAPLVNPKHWNAHSFADKLFFHFYDRGIKHVQRQAQLRQLFKTGKLTLPDMPPVVEIPVDAVASTKGKKVVSSAAKDLVS